MATIACAAMIAQQVAGKAARDALFLSTLRIEHLPLMMATSAAVSLLAALGVSRLMVRYAPDRVVPTAFAVSGVALLANWGLSFVAARPSAVVLYLHTAVFGAVVISAFWSLVNETFAFRSGRRAMRWITGGGTVGGLIGGLVAWRLAHLVRLPSMLLLLAALDVICIWGTYRLKRTAPRAARREPTVRAATPSLWRTPYLRNLALVVALGAVTSGLLDYAFSEVAIERFAGGSQLLSFFAKFWLVVGLLSVVLETVFARRWLRKAGLAATEGDVDRPQARAGVPGARAPSRCRIDADRVSRAAPGGRADAGNGARVSRDRRAGPGLRAAVASACRACPSGRSDVKRRGQARRLQRPSSE